MTADRNDSDETLDVEVMAALLNAQSPLPPPPALRARVLERVRQAVAHGFTTTRCLEGWRRLAPGIEVKRLSIDEGAGTVSFLVRAETGASLPPHRHTQGEECLVLEGEFTMGDLTMRAGDFHYAPAGSEHAVAVAITPVLVYMRGAMVDYPFV